ncbi:hypothetical protein [Dongia mobilis]|jgi:hypothetical protein|uniref:hypothetical protein n=1 Tax=Dongia sp. TaxID=1977262 RepID=UPI0026F2AA70
MSKTQDDSHGAQRLTHDDVTRLVGDLDDSVIAAILATGANYTEIEQALKWIDAGLEEPRLNAQGLTPIAELVCDILLSTTEFSSEDPLHPN